MHDSTKGKKWIWAAAKRVPIVSAAISFSTAIALLTSRILSRSISSTSAVTSFLSGEVSVLKAAAASETETAIKSQDRTGPSQTTAGGLPVFSSPFSGCLQLISKGGTTLGR